MSKFRKEVKVKEKDFYFMHLSILNPFLPVKLLTKEIHVLSSFMSIKESLVEDDRFGMVARSIVKKDLGISTAGLSNYIRNLKVKGALKEINGKLEVLPILFPKESTQSYEFKIVKDDTN